MPSLGHSSVDSQPSSVEIRQTMKSYMGELYPIPRPGGQCMGTWSGYGAKLHALIHGRGRKERIERRRISINTVTVEGSTTK